MGNDQKSGTRDSVKNFYILIYKKFNEIVREYIGQNHQQNINEDFDGDDFIHYFDKYFKNFVENGKFFVEKNSYPYLELHTEGGDFVFVNNNIENVKSTFNTVPFNNCKKLAEEMGYDFKSYTYEKENNKQVIKRGFCVPFSDFEREIIICAFEILNRRANQLEKEKEVLSKEKEDLEKEVLPKRNEIKNLKYDKRKYEKIIKDLEWEIKDSKDQNERLISEISKIKSDNVTFKVVLNEANKKLAERNKVINALILKIKKDSKME